MAIDRGQLVFVCAVKNGSEDVVDRCGGYVIVREMRRGGGAMLSMGVGVRGCVGIADPSCQHRS